MHLFTFINIILCIVNIELKDTFISFF